MIIIHFFSRWMFVGVFALGSLGTSALSEHAFVDDTTDSTKRPQKEIRPQVSCPHMVSDIADALQKMTHEKSPWPTIKTDELRLGLVEAWGKKTEVYLFGYSEKELSQAHIAFEGCKGSASIVHILHVEDVLHPDADPKTVHLMVPERWAGEVNLDFKEPMLCNKTHLPLYCMPFDIERSLEEGYTKKILKNPELLAVSLTHENFHAFQFHRFKKFFHWAGPKDPKEMERCQTNQEWMADMEKELRDWEVLYEGKEAPKSSEIRRVVTGILKRRAHGNNIPKVRDCWRWLEFGESVEGCPTFFSTELSRTAGFKDVSDPMFICEEKKFSVTNKNLFDNNQTIYYLTGAFCYEQCTMLPLRPVGILI